jgi:hypothetical protein
MNVQPFDKEPQRLRALVTARMVIAWRLWLEVVCALLRRRRPSQAVAANLGPGLRFSLHKGAISSIVVALTVIASCVDIPLIHLLSNNHVPAALRGTFHAALLALNAAGLIWIIGQRSAVTHIPHVVGPVILRLRVGFRLEFDLPLSAVSGASILKGSPREWIPARGLTRADVTLVTPMDEPNVLLEIGGDLDAVRGLRAGRAMRSTRYLAIRVDDAEGFRRAIAR